MKWSEVEKSWDQMHGEFKKKWTKLSDKELKEIGGNRRKLEKKLKQHYNLKESEVKNRVDKFIDGLKSPKRRA